MPYNYFKLLGIFMFSYSALTLSSCEKQLSQNNFQSSTTLSDTSISDTTIFIDITLNGTRVLGIQNLSAPARVWGQIWPGETGPTGDTSVYIGNRIGAEFADISPNQLFFFTKGNCTLPVSNDPAYLPPLPSEVFIDSFFSPKNLDYSVKGNDTSFITNAGVALQKHLLTDGITIAWVDSTGTLWTTFNGTADQIGSFFNLVTNQVPAQMSWGNLTVITANFECNLYDNLGHSLKLTNGSFRQPIYQ